MKRKGPVMKISAAVMILLLSVSLALAGNLQGNSVLAAGGRGVYQSDGQKNSAEKTKKLLAGDAVDMGDFSVSDDAENASFDSENGVLRISGDVTVSMKEGKTSTTQSIIIENNAKVVLDGVTINSAHGPAILVKSPYTAELVLKEENKVTGSEGTDINHIAGSYAGIEVEFEYESGSSPSNRMASLIISGDGSLEATGGKNGAGIGGSNSAGGSSGRGLYGNITINSGTVKATSPDSGAGIGSSDNPGDGTSSGSYKKTENNVWGTITINGGNVTAVSGNRGAGIGGGNHVDSGKIVINGGTVSATGAAGIGCGIGSSKNKGDHSTTFDKGPGFYFADVEINGGSITASSNDVGAAIGGGMYCDAIIKITGGEINATGGSREGLTHHGGAGIGGGYLGHADVTITGGNITAVGGDGAAGIGSGGSPNSNEDRGINGRATNGVTKLDKTAIDISGGTIDATGGPKGGAGIGLGAGGDKAEITITGGEIKAQGAKSSESEMRGGAGIGSGFQGTGTEASKYFTDAHVDITITGGDVLAISGWGASGIGSGADNIFAETIKLDAYAPDNEDGAKIQAYSDGTKFAIDTRNLKSDGKTDSYMDGRSVEGYILQGTFVHKYEIDEGDETIRQNPEGLKSIIITNDRTNESRELTLMPDKYRSYATNVSEAGVYTVYTDQESIGEGEGRYFSVCDYDRFERSDHDNFVQYTVGKNDLSDNFYLFPVKTVVVEKIVSGDSDATKGLNTTAYFALFEKGQNRPEKKNGHDEPWVEKIEIKNGKPQSKAYFVNVEDKHFDVREVRSRTDMTSPEGDMFKSAVLRRITTQHGELITVDGERVETDRLIITRMTAGDRYVIKAVLKNTSPEDTMTVSLFSDKTLIEDSSMKLNRANDFTCTWTVDRKKNGKEVTYSVADTTNNASISHEKWSDEVKIINTYEKKKDRPDPKPDPEKEKKKKPGTPKTGDDTEILLLLSLLAASGLALSVLVRNRKKLSDAGSGTDTE